MKCVMCDKPLPEASADLICEKCDEIISKEERRRFKKIAAERASREASLRMFESNKP